MAEWKSAFGYCPINYNMCLALFEDQTQRIIFDNNLNGRSVRLRLSNKYSSSPLHIKHMTVGIEKSGCVRDLRDVTVNGSCDIMLAPGEESWSDEAELTVNARDRIAITSYIEEKQPIESVCNFWSDNGQVVHLSSNGDFTNGETFDSVPSRKVYSVIEEDPCPLKAYFFYGVSGLQVLTDDEVKTIAMFGDSITHMSYASGELNRRLRDACPGKITLINRGIGGNRLLHDASKADSVVGDGCIFGQAGIKRFEQDVFGLETVDIVLVLEGINDIVHPVQFDHPDEIITAAELESGYKYLIETAKRHGAKILGSTIMPCGHQDYPVEWLAEFEAIRQDANRRIREGAGFDGVIDYDAAIRDESRPGYMLQDCHIGDGVHPNDRGGSLMADAIMKELHEHFITEVL